MVHHHPTPSTLGANTKQVKGQSHQKVGRSASLWLRSEYSDCVF